MRIFVQNQVEEPELVAEACKKITAGIELIFRGLFFEHNAETGRKDH